MEVSEYRKSDGERETAPRTVRSTLYNPLRGYQLECLSKLDILADSSPNMLMLPCILNFEVPQVNNKFVQFPKGSVISYHQPLESNCIINMYDGVVFPDLP